MKSSCKKSSEKKLKQPTNSICKSTLTNKADIYCGTKYLTYFNDHIDDYQSFDLLKQPLQFVNIFKENGTKIKKLSSIIFPIELKYLTESISANNCKFDFIYHDKKEYDNLHEHFEKKYIDTNKKYLLNSHMTLEEITGDKIIPIKKIPIKKSSTKKNNKETQSTKKNNKETQSTKNIDIENLNTKKTLKKNSKEIAITKSNFWDEIDKFNYRDRRIVPHVTQLKLNKNTIKYFIQTPVYIKKYTQLVSVLTNIVSLDMLDKAIHHIIFSGEQLFNYIFDSPDFILYIINEKLYHDIPQFIS